VARASPHLTLSRKRTKNQDAKIQRMNTKENQESKKEYKE